MEATLLPDERTDLVSTIELFIQNYHFQILSYNMITHKFFHTI